MEIKINQFLLDDPQRVSAMEESDLFQEVLEELEEDDLRALSAYRYNTLFDHQLEAARCLPSMSTNWRVTLEEESEGGDILSINYEPSPADARLFLLGGAKDYSSSPGKMG